MDRLSNLPEPILQRILYFVIDDKEAARTCVLSKSWHHIWSNRPKLYLSERTLKKDFLFHANITLQSLLHQNHHQGIAEFHLTISTLNSESVAFLQRWIPMLTTMSIKHLRLNIGAPNNNDEDGDGVDLPFEAFAAESLQKLRLYRCNLLLQDHNVIPFKHHLTTLCLCHVSVKEDEQNIVDHIISSCPLLTSMRFEKCKGLRNVKVNHKNLSHFTFICHESYTRIVDCSIEIDLPTLETIYIIGSEVWFHNHEYSKLKSLYLATVKISSNSFDKLSPCSFPSLEDLTLNYYSYSGGLLYIDAPNIVNFISHGINIPSISFTATSGKWSSHIAVSLVRLDDAQSWFLMLSCMLHLLSQSEISLSIVLVPNDEEDPIALENIDIDIGASIDPVVVDHLTLSGYVPSFPAYLDVLFRICHPRRITHIWRLSAHNKMVEKQLTEFLCKYLNQQDHFPSEMRIRSIDFGGGRCRATEQEPMTNFESFHNQLYGYKSFYLKWRVDC